MRNGKLKFIPPAPEERYRTVNFLRFEMHRIGTHRHVHRYQTITQESQPGAHKERQRFSSTASRTQYEQLSFSVPLPEKPFTVVRDEEDAKEFAQKKLEEWRLPNPNLIISVVGGTKYFDAWKREDHRAAFQKGLMKIVRSMEVWILDDGLNYGITKLIGTAVKNEERQRNRRVNYGIDGRFTKHHNFTTIGIVPCSLVINAEQMLARHDDIIEIIPKANIPHLNRFSFHYHHTHYVLLERPYSEACVLRAQLERHIQKQCGSREEKSDPTSETSLGDELPPSTIRYPSDERVPLVVLLFQGDLDQLNLIHHHLENFVPVILLEGCGYLADILAMAVRDRDAVGSDRQVLTQQLSQRLLEDFPEELRGREVERMAYVEKIMECARLARQGFLQLVSVVECSQPVHEFSDLDKVIFKSIFSSQSNLPNSAQFDRNLQFTIRCNRPEFAKTDILNKKPWRKMLIPNSSFEAALLQAEREAFVDMFLQQDFLLHKYLSHLKLVKLFRNALDRAFFMTEVWEKILHRSEDILPKSFVEDMLPHLLHHLAKFPVIVSAYRLSMNSVGNYIVNAVTAERRAIIALISWAVLMNRAGLAKLLCKFCDDPIPTALYISALYRGLASHQTDYELEQRLLARRKEFAIFATDILNLSVQDQATERVADILNERFQDFGYRTPVQIAYDSNNKWFLAHPGCQSWLNDFYMGDIKVSERFMDFRIVLSAFLVFPMYFWIRFPKYEMLLRATNRPGSTDSYNPDRDINIDVNNDLQRTNFMEELEKLRLKETRHASRLREPPAKKIAKRKKHFPPLWMMIKTTWEAPVTKFWTFQVSYWAFLILLGVATMMPNCRNTYINGAVLIFTASFLLECILRAAYEYVNGMPVPWMHRSVEIIFIFVFVILFLISEVFLEFKFVITQHLDDEISNRLFGAFAGRIVMCFGVLYFYYRVVTLFFPISRTLGPMLYRIQRMLSQDFVTFLKLLFPFFVANIIVLQTAIFPDWQMTWETWRKAFFRGFFSIFVAPVQTELEPLSRCDPLRISKNNASSSSAPQDHCLAGQYTDPTCPTVTFFSYGFSIQFLVLLRLVLLVILTAMFNNTLTAIKAEADAIWKYQRYSLIMQFASRPPLPPPFSAFGYLYMLIRSIKRRNRHDATTDIHPQNARETSFIGGPFEFYSYWMNLTKDYFHLLATDEQEKNMGHQNLDRLKSLGADLTAQKRLLDQLLDGVGDTSKMATAAAFEAQTVRHKVRSMNVMDPFSEGTQIHIQSRQSPYPETGLMRFNLLDDYCPWDVELGIYDPKEYSKPLEVYQESERKEVDTIKPTPVITNYMWNVMDVGRPEAVDRKSWIKDEKGGEGINYSIGKTGMPLNPYGRTGLQGRGVLRRYGPNHSVRLLFTCREDPKSLLVAVEDNRRSYCRLPHTFVLSAESECEAILRLTLHVTNLSTTPGISSESEPNKLMELLQREISKRQKAPRFTATSLPDMPEAPEEEAPKEVSTKELFRGYVDDIMNTDNAWIECVVWLVRVPKIPLDGTVRCRWSSVKLTQGMPEFDVLMVRREQRWRVSD